MECIAIQQAQYLGEYKIRITFNTGEVGDVDLTETIHRYPIARPLLDMTVFSNFRLDDWPTLTWDCGFDIAPETLYRNAGFGSSDTLYSNVAETPECYSEKGSR
jgi:hypothetical protein